MGLAAIPVQKNRRPFPFRHKPSFKKQLPPPQKIQLKNPFQILGSLSPDPPSSPKKTTLPLSCPAPSLPASSPFNQTHLFVPLPDPELVPDSSYLTTVSTEDDPLHPNGEASDPSL